MGGSGRDSVCDPSGQTWSVRDSVCDPSGQTWSVRDIYDGSAFPTASGVNPMVTIEALAHMNSRRLAERLA